MTGNGFSAHVYDSNEPIPAITIPPDGVTHLDFPVKIREAAKQWQSSPKWGAQGHLTLRCGNIEEIATFDLHTDRYQFSEKEWCDIQVDFARLGLGE